MSSKKPKKPKEQPWTDPLEELRVKIVSGEHKGKEGVIVEWVKEHMRFRVQLGARSALVGAGDLRI